MRSKHGRAVPRRGFQLQVAAIPGLTVQAGQHDGFAERRPKRRSAGPAPRGSHGDGHVTSGGSPLAGQTVTFTVTGQNAGASGTCVPVGCVTDASGNVSFTYHDGNGAGEDTIKASFTDAGGSLQSATAQKHWAGGAPPKPTELSTSLSGGGQSGGTITVPEGTAVSRQRDPERRQRGYSDRQVSYTVYSDKDAPKKSPRQVHSGK